MRPTSTHGRTRVRVPPWVMGIEWSRMWPGAFMARADGVHGTGQIHRMTDAGTQPEEWQALVRSTEIGHYPTEELAREAVEAVFIADLDAVAANGPE